MKKSLIKGLIAAMAIVLLIVVGSFFVPSPVYEKLTQFLSDLLYWFV